MSSTDLACRAQYKRAPSPALRDENDTPQNYLDSHGVEHAFETTAPKLSEIDDELHSTISSIETAAPLSSKSDFIVKHVK